MVIFIGYGAGGSEALKEIYTRIENKYKIEVYAISDFAKSKLGDIAEQKTIEEVKDIIKLHRPRLVVSERSNGIKEHKEITELCKSEGISNLVIMDIFLPWANNYKDLFSELPDYVTALSTGSFKSLLEVGFIEEQILKSGSPAYLRLESIVKKEINIEVPKILYASQGGKGNISFEETETMFNDFIRVIGSSFKDYIVDIKLHPMEEELREDWLRITSKHSQVNILHIDKSVDFLTEYINSYDLVIGKHSTLQVQAQQLNIPVIYYTDEIEHYITLFKSGKNNLMYKDELDYYKPMICDIIDLIEQI